MALHRDIYWVGRQWAVTGYGLQAVDQRLKGHFDIEISRLWDDGLLESMQSERWLNTEDFSKGLSLARARYPEPPRKAAPPQSIVSPSKHEDPIEPPKLVATPPKPMIGPPKSVVTPPKALAQKFEMRIDSWPAKFIRPWRVGLQRQRV
jgi:hypothetical protein